MAVVGEGGRPLRNYDVVLPVGEARQSALDALQSARDAGADIKATVQRELNANEDRIATLLRDMRDSRSKDDIDSLSRALTTLVDYGRYLQTFAQVPAQIEQVYSRVAFKENLRMWGKLYLPRVGQAGGGWLIDSWTEGGAPYWRPKMTWLDRIGHRLQRAYLNFDTGAIQYGEDSEMEPERAQFIRETVQQWEKEWLKEQEKSAS